MNAHSLRDQVGYFLLLGQPHVSLPSPTPSGPQPSIRLWTFHIQEFDLVILAGYIFFSFSFAFTFHRVLCHLLFLTFVHLSSRSCDDRALAVQTRKYLFVFVMLLHTVQPQTPNHPNEMAHEIHPNPPKTQPSQPQKKGLELRHLLY